MPRVNRKKAAPEVSTDEVELYRRMLLIREFELRLYALFRAGKLVGTTHACTGQEAIAVGVIDHLDRERDVITSNHRGHGHFLAFHEDVEGLLAELVGLETGVCGGHGGSQHLHAKGFYSNGILGSMVPIGVGMALAEKAKGSRAVVVNFMGDGTLGQGVVYEAANMAALWRLPVVFCVENNRYQQAVPVERAVAGDLVERGRAFGLETAHLDGNDVLEVRRRMGPIIARARMENVPHWVVFETYRMAGHSKSDDCAYRSPEEEEAWRARDPLVRLAAHLDPRDVQRAEDLVRACLDDAEAAVSWEAKVDP